MKKRNEKQKEVIAHVVGKTIFAVDQGYSYCKCMTSEKCFKFPTAIAAKKVAGFEGAREEGLYTFNGRDYRVGDDAVKSDAKKYLRDISFLLDYAPLLVAHSIILSGLDAIPEILVVGLPLFEHFKYQEELQKRLALFIVNGITYKFDNVKVFPQGMGTLADYITTTNPDSNEDGYVFDVGFNTVISLRYNGLSAQQEGSRQYDQMGISRPLEELINALKVKHGYNLDLISLNAAFVSGAIRGDVGGQINIKELAEPIMAEYLDELINTLKNDFGRYFNQSQRLILSGGGAYYLSELIPSEYRSKVYVPPMPEFANVRGFFQVGG